MTRRNSYFAQAMLLALVCGLNGCSRDAQPSSAPPLAQTPAELSFAEQVERVRQGESGQIAIAEETIVDADLAKVSQLANLRELLLERSEITDGGVAHLQANRNLEHLRIRGGAVGDEGLRVLATLPKLRFLNLPHSQITDDGLSVLAEAKQLEMLRLGGPRLSDKAAAHIGRVASLRSVHLIDIPLTDAGLEKLAALPNLESLYLDGAEITDDGVAKLLAAIPDLHLHLDQQHHDRDPRGHDHHHEDAP